MASPGMPKPPGGDVDRSPVVLGVYWAEAVVAIIMVSLRMYARRLTHAIGWDDWTMLIALVRSLDDGLFLALTDTLL